MRSTILTGILTVLLACALTLPADARQRRGRTAVEALAVGAAIGAIAAGAAKIFTPQRERRRVVVKPRRERARPVARARDEAPRAPASGPARQTSRNGIEPYRSGAR